MAASAFTRKVRRKSAPAVKAYFALKLAGVPGGRRACLERSRERILALGGLQAANSYVKINLSLFGLYPREHTPQRFLPS